MSLPVTCGEGNEYRTRDVASPAERGGRECRGKKYSIGGKVRSRRFFFQTVVTVVYPLPLPSVVWRRLLSPGLRVVQLGLV